MMRFKHLAAYLVAAGAVTGCALDPGEGVRASPLNVAGEFFVPTPIADQMQQLIDDSGATPMFASPTTRASVLNEFRSTGYQKLAFFESNIAPIAGETRVDLGTREVRLARPSASSETPASMIAKWFGSSTGAFYARNAHETLDVLREALGATGAENPDVVIITQGAGSISATRGGSPFAITAAGRCPSITTVSACLQQLAGTSGWTVLQPYSGTGGFAVTGLTLSHPVIELFKNSGLTGVELAVKNWVATNPTLADVSLTSDTYKP